MIKIRNHLAHSGSGTRILELEIGVNGEKLFNDNFDENFWKLTKIPKDIFIIGYNDAKKAKDINDNIILQLDEFIKGKIIKNNWLKSQNLEII